MNRINNLKELKAEKQRIKQRLEQTKAENDKSPLKVLLPLLAIAGKGKKKGKKEKKNKKGALSLFNPSPKKLDSPYEEGVKEVLTLVATLAVSRFKMGSLAKVLVTTGVAILTPIIVSKIQGNKQD